MQSGVIIMVEFGAEAIHEDLGNQPVCKNVAQPKCTPLLTIAHRCPQAPGSEWFSWESTEKISGMGPSPIQRLEKHPIPVALKQD